MNKSKYTLLFFHCLSIIPKTVFFSFLQYSLDSTFPPISTPVTFSYMNYYVGFSSGKEGANTY